MTTPSETRLKKGERLHVRANSEEKALIRRAAAFRHQNASEFVLQSALTSAERVLADRTRFVLDEDQWESFQQALERSPARKPRLETLLTQPSVLERE